MVGFDLHAPIHQALYDVRPWIVVRSNRPFLSAPVPVDGSRCGSPALFTSSASSSLIKFSKRMIGGSVLTKLAPATRSTIASM